MGIDFSGEPIHERHARRHPTRFRPGRGHRPAALRAVRGPPLTGEGASRFGHPDFGVAADADPGLIWGVDFTDDGPRPVALCDSPHPGEFRWLHLNLADQGARTWIERANLPSGARELLLSPDTHQRTVIEGDVVCCILHDLEREFDRDATSRIGPLRVALAPNIVITARLHPLGFADIVKHRVMLGARIDTPALALDMIVGAIVQNIEGVTHRLSAEVQQAEDRFLSGRGSPDSRDLLRIRRHLAQLHRMLGGMQRVFRRLEEDDDLPEALSSTVKKDSQRLQGLDADALAVQGQLLLLRDEIDLQRDQRTNQNLYLLSIVSALLLPATLVTGWFGMNTGGLPMSGPGGTIGATLIMIGTATGTYLWLRRKGFFQ